MTRNKKKFKTYDEHFADMLREIEPATLMEMAEALNMGSPPLSILKSAIRNGFIKKNTKTFPATYTVIERVPYYD